MRITTVISLGIHPRLRDPEYRTPEHAPISYVSAEMVVAPRDDAMIAAHFHIGRVGPVIESVAFARGLSRQGLTRSLVSSHIRLTGLLETAAPPIALTSSSTERFETPCMEASNTGEPRRFHMSTTDGPSNAKHSEHANGYPAPV